jgi:hypothetical protein
MRWSRAKGEAAKGQIKVQTVDGVTYVWTLEF